MSETSLNLTGAVVLVTREGMGTGPLELQHKVITTFFTLLLENQWKPTAVCFYTEGVKLLAEGSPIIDLLRQVEASGVRLIGCKTCLDYFGLSDVMRVGIVGGMGDILAALALGSKVITI